MAGRGSSLTRIAQVVERTFAFWLRIYQHLGFLCTFSKFACSFQTERANFSFC